MLMKCIAVVRVRGLFSNPPQVRKTMECLKLTRVNSCTLVADTPQNMGMLQVVREHVAYCEVSMEIVAALLYKRGRGKIGSLKAMGETQVQALAAKVHANPSEIAGLGISKPFFLSPPAGGYDETKFMYPKGALGKRPDMDKLLKSMLRA